VLAVVEPVVVAVELIEFVAVELADVVGEDVTVLVPVVKQSTETNCSKID